MKRALLAVRAAILWVLSLLHFFIVTPVLVFLGIFLDPRKHDYLQRGLCRRIVFLSGARLGVQRAPGFDPKLTCLFMVNHVNVFDPFSCMPRSRSLCAAGNWNRTSKFRRTAG
jgi:hypothetical protein